MAGINLQTAKAGDREWATAGKILTGVAVGAIVVSALDCEPAQCSVSYTYGAPPYPPPAPVVYAPPPVVVVAPRPVVCAPPPVVVYRPSMYVERPRPLAFARVTHHGGHDRHEQNHHR
jgi:hypothetical protein